MQTQLQNEGRCFSRQVRLLWAAITLVGSIATLHAQRLTWLGTLGGDWSEARGVTPDGSVVVGIAVDDQSRYRAFRWTSQTGMQDLGTLGGRNSMAYGVSADGSKIVGASEIDANGNERATLWDNGMAVDLGTLTYTPGPNRSGAYAISADGRYVGGYSYTSLNTAFGGVSRACRWDLSQTPPTIELLDNTQIISQNPPARRPTGSGSCVLAISADGKAMTGFWGFGWGYGGFYWNDDAQNPDLYQDKFYQLIGLLNPYGHRGRGTGYGISADGKVLVGYATDALLHLQAARYVYDPQTNRLGDPEFLGSLGGVFSIAHAANTNGSVIVGWATLSNGEGRAFIWDAQNGMQDLNTLYASLLTDGSILERAIAMSPDGRYIAGIGYNATSRRREAFLLDTSGQLRQRTGDVDGDGCVDDADLLAVLFTFGSSDSRTDVNSDGTVDDADLLTVLFNFGSGCNQ